MFWRKPKCSKIETRYRFMSRNNHRHWRTGTSCGEIHDTNRWAWFFFVYWSVLFNISRTVCGSSRLNGPSCPMLIILIWPPIILGEPPFRSRVLGIPREGNLTKIVKYCYSWICNGVSIKTSRRLFT